MTHGAGVRIWDGGAGCEGWGVCGDQGGDFGRCRRFLNAVEPGMEIPIHRHATKDESFVLLRGKVRVTIHNDDGSVKESVVLNLEKGLYGVDIPKGVWYKLDLARSRGV